MRALFGFLAVCGLFVMVGCNENKGTEGETAEDDDARFVKWAKDNHTLLNSIPVTDGNSDLETIFKDADKYKVIALSEGFHNCKEMLQLHHRMIRYLVEEHGFNTVVTESGLPESRLAYDYVQNRSVAGNPWEDGINKMYAHWTEGRELIQWMREYNSSHGNQLAYYGIDIGGFYQNWKAPLSNVLSYLSDVAPDFAKIQKAKWEPWLDILSEEARVRYLNVLSQTDRDQLARTLEQLTTYFKDHQDELLAKSTMLEYEWAKQSAMAMAMAENYYRNYMSQRNGTRKYAGLNGREIAMADNIKWVLSHRKDAKVIVINHVVHNKTQTQHQEGLYGIFTPMGEFLKQELKDSLFTIGTTYGGGKFWNDWHNLESRYIDTIPQSKPDGIEKTMAQIADRPFYVHWKDSTNVATNWMEKLLVLRENNYFINIKPTEWDACIYLPMVGPGSLASQIE